MKFEEALNKLYTDKEIINLIRKEYILSDGLIRLDNFFNTSFYLNLFKKLKGFEGKKMKIVDKHCYSSLIIDREFRNFFLNKGFCDFISNISGKRVKNASLFCKEFGVGDYVLLHDSELRKGIDFLFIFCNFWQDNFGGQIVYTDNLDDGKTFIFSIKGNSFVLINAERLGKFVKYVNHLAGKKKFFLVGGKFLRNK